MPLMANADFRPTDITTYIPISILAAGAALPISTAGGVRFFQTSVPTKILAMRVVTGSAAPTGITYTAASDVRPMDATVTPVTTLNNVLATTSVVSVANSTVNVPIDTFGTDTLPATLPAGTYVGFNHTSVATAASSICGVLLTYRLV